MTMQALYSVLPILIALGLGFITSKYLLPSYIVYRLVRLISPFVWSLLFLIGVEFGEVVSSLEAMAYVLQTSLLIAVVTTLLPCLLLLGGALFTRKVRTTQPRKGVVVLDIRAAAAPLKECAIALLMVASGVLLNTLRAQAETSIGRVWLPSSHYLLMGLIFLVGLDFSSFKLGRSWISYSALSVPIVVVAGSILGAYAVHFMTGEDIRLLLALSTGFGWFTLSSVMIGGLSGELYGAIALLVDLGRELISIVLLYLLGGILPRVGIAAAGATALDSTLPIVRQTCSNDMLPVALLSGFILTLLAPVFITFFLTA